MRGRPNLTPELRGEQMREFLRCRTIGHAWEVVPHDYVPSFGTAVSLRCTSCATWRHDIFSRLSGELIQRWYDYSDHYRDVEKHDKAWWRSSWAETLDAKQYRERAAG